MPCLLLCRNADTYDYRKIQIYITLSFIHYMNKMFQQYGTSTGKMERQKGHNTQKNITDQKPQNLHASAVILICKDRHNI